MRDHFFINGAEQGDKNKEVRFFSSVDEYG
jgi:hypothetical protein